MDDQGQPDEKVDAEAAEAERYLAAVLEELRIRERRVAAIDQEIAQLRFHIEQYHPTRLVRSGDVRAVVSADAYRRKVQEQIDGKERERSEAAAEVARAQERRVMIEEELREQKDSQ